MGQVTSISIALAKAIHIAMCNFKVDRKFNPTVQLEADRKKYVGNNTDSSKIKDRFLANFIRIRFLDLMHPVSVHQGLSWCR